MLKSIEITHRPGKHCGSSAIRDLLEFHGLNLTEAFCFGLGAGLGITYLDLKQGPLPYIVHVRSMDFESKAFDTLSVPFKWQTFSTKPAAAEALNEAMALRRPALLLTDIRHLPYFETQNHFPGHAIVAWQSDPIDGTIYVTDTERPTALKVPENALTEARFSVLPPFLHDGNMFAPESIRAVLDEKRIFEAIKHNARVLGGEDIKQCEGTTIGLPALSRWINDMPKWLESENPQWLLRFAYQVIEKRGTGGGGFRLMYADFLNEVEDIIPEVKTRELADLMRCCATNWSALAKVFREASESALRVDSSWRHKINASIEQVYVSEQRYVKAVLC